MPKSRLENFSDAVIAIILTIMVLELHILDVADWHEIVALYPVFISYSLSFLFIGIYWVNHHHLLHAVRFVNSRILWMNLFLLFSLSLIPWGTGVMGENHFSELSVTIYTILCMLPAVAYNQLSTAILCSKSPDTDVLNILKKMRGKEVASLLLYIAAFLCSFFASHLSLIIIFVVSCLWLIPNREIEAFFSRAE